MVGGGVDSTNMNVVNVGAAAAVTLTLLLLFVALTGCCVLFYQNIDIEDDCFLDGCFLLLLWLFFLLLLLLC